MPVRFVIHLQLLCLSWLCQFRGNACAVQQRESTWRLRLADATFSQPSWMPWTLPRPRLPPLRALQGELLRRLQQPLRKSLRPQTAGSLDLGAIEEMVSDSVSCNESWVLKVSKDQVRVWRRSDEGCAYDEVRGNGLIRAPPAVVLALLKQGDADTIREYNPMYDDGYDLQQIDKNTKVSYGSVRAIFPFKPRDTVTRVALRELPNVGGTVLLLHAADHSAMPERPGYVRAKILKGMHLVQPVKGKPGLTNFTFTQQVNAGGVLPAWLMNVLIAQDAVVFIQRLETAAAARR